MKKLLVLLSVLIFSVTIFSGCGSSNTSSSNAANYGENAEIRIALLGSSTQFKTRDDFITGIDLAIEELQKNNVKISYEKIDDGGSHDKSIALAKDIANSNKYTIAYSFQTADIFESVAEIFNKAKKPLMSVDQCFDSTMQEGFEYVLAGIVSAERSGASLANYCANNGYKWIAAAHSNTTFENNVTRGFIDTANSNKTVNLIDSVAGPNTIGEFSGVWNKWDTLGVDAVLVCFDDVEWACDLITQIKSKKPNMLILGDAKFNNIDMMKKYKDVLEGTIVAGSYGVDSEEKIQSFYNKYETRIMNEKGLDITTITAQGYDLTAMTAEKVKISTDALSFMKNMKSSDRYEGYTGVTFNARGQLEEDPVFWVIKNSQVYRIK